MPLVPHPNTFASDVSADIHPVNLVDRWQGSRVMPRCDGLFLVADVKEERSGVAEGDPAVD